jgi:hypothetical protein
MGEGKRIMTITTDRRARSIGQASALRQWLRNNMARNGQASARRLTALLSSLLVVAALAGCAPSQPTVKTPTATATPSATATPRATPRLVYQADWSHGLAGWEATPGWTVSGGVLRSDMGPDRQITIPYRPTTSNYAVEFRLQLVSVSESQTAPRQYSLSADSAPGTDGYIALVDKVMLHQCMFACHPQESIYIDPMVDQDFGSGIIQVHDFEPRTHLLTYRVEVRGPEAALLIEGHQYSFARSAKTPQLATGPIRFYCTGVALQLSDLKIYAL